MLCKLLYYLKYNKHIRADSVSKRGTTLPGLSELVCCVQAGVGAARQGCPLSRASKCRLCSQVCACICALFASQQKTGAVDVFFFSLQPCKKCQNVGVKLCNPVRGMPDLLPGLVLHHGVLAFSTYMLTAPTDFAELLASVAAHAIGSQCLA